MSGHSHSNHIVPHRNVIDEIDDVLAQPGIFCQICRSEQTNFGKKTSGFAGDAALVVSTSMQAYLLIQVYRRPCVDAATIVDLT